MLSALNTPWKTRDVIHSWMRLPLVRLHFHFKGIVLKKNRHFFGIAIVQKHRQSVMRFGDEMSLCSSSRSNSLGPKYPVFITTWQSGAVRKIVYHYTVTGETLCAAERIEMGDHATIGANVMVVDSDFHPIDPVHRLTHPYDGQTSPVIFESNVFIGANSLTLKRVKIGEGSVIGAGSVITRDIPSGVIAAGKPARVIKEILHSE